jgi:glycosyltransferase involved in cell wall biosynthesis
MFVTHPLMTISIVIVYYNRQCLLDKTLDSLRKYNPDSFNVIVVDNASDEVVIIPDLPYEVRRVRVNDKSYPHCSYSFNVGFHEAKSDIIVFQGAEMYHEGDILSHAKNIKDNQYISFQCYSLGQGEMPELYKINNKCMTFDGESAWYNHPIYRPVNYPFCAAIKTSNLIKLNGFDERFIGGVGYEDNYLLHQIKMLGLESIISDQLVLHQWHSQSSVRTPQQRQRNKSLYETLSKSTTYRAIHTVTKKL